MNHIPLRLFAAISSLIFSRHNKKSKNRRSRHFRRPKFAQ